jgi:hypothetical protein
MTLVTLQRPLVWPGNTGSVYGAFSQNTYAANDAAGEYTAWVLQAVEDMTISHISAVFFNTTGSPTADIRIETVDSSGLPSGTLWATNTNAISATLTAATVVTALTAPASITKGQIFCLKIAHNSGTSYTVVRLGGRRDPSSFNLPYAVTNTGTPTKATLIDTPYVAFGSNSTTFYNVPGFMGGSLTGGGSFNNTNGARRGLRFTAQFNCRCAGLEFPMATANGDYNAILMDDAGSELSSSSTAFDGDQNVLNNTAITRAYFDNPVTLSAGTTYRAVLEPTSATNITLSTLALSSADYRSTSPCGTFGHYTTYASAAWTDSATATIPFLDLILDQIDDGAGSGSGSRQKVYGG